MSTLQPTEATPAEIAPAEFLRRLGEAGDGPHDLAHAGLMLAALDRPEKSLAPLRAHLAEIADTVRAESQFARHAESAARALSSIIAGHYGYEGEREHYDDPLNADMIAVLERRRGLPVALGILYIQAARAGGMEACGLLSPGHFLLKLTVKGSEALIDPFNGGALVEREHIAAPGFGVSDLTDLEHEDPADALLPVGDADVLLRLQNNIKTRALRTRETTRAIEILRRMILIAPRRSILWLELAHLQESMGALSAARTAYETCLTLSRAGEGIANEAAFALHALKLRLN
ncbi:MAG TPA: transglutaminase-like domain-containing protein [Micropepsaceae bacterium]|nr:transglutaminase-like domain-containing protein [Micropepsaceae bacterium]